MNEKSQAWRPETPDLSASAQIQLTIRPHGSDTASADPPWLATQLASEGPSAPQDPSSEIAKDHGPTRQTAIPGPTPGRFVMGKSILLWLQLCLSSITGGLRQWTLPEVAHKKWGKVTLEFPRDAFKASRGLGPTLALLKFQPQGCGLWLLGFHNLLDDWIKASRNHARARISQRCFTAPLQVGCGERRPAR